MQCFNYILPLITLPYLVRVLGPKSYGALMLSLACMQYLVIITEYGFNYSASKSIAQRQQDKQQVSKIFWSVTCAKIFLALICSIVLIILIEIVPTLREFQPALYACFPLVISNILLPIWLLQGMEKMANIAIANIASRMIILPLTFVYVNNSNDIWIAALIQSSAGLLASLICIQYIYSSRMILLTRPTMHEIKKQLSDGWSIFISSVATSFYTSSVTVILGLVTNTTALGYFVAADKIRNAIQGLITPVSQVIYPRISNLIVNSIHDAEKLWKKVAILFGSGLFIVCVFVFIMAPQIVNIAYSEKYEPAIIILRILAFTPFIVFVSNMFAMQLMLPIGMNKIFSLIIVRSAIICIPFIFAFSYLSAGVGAAWAILFVEASLCLQFIRAIMKNLTIREVFFTYK